MAYSLLRGPAKANYCTCMHLLDTHWLISAAVYAQVFHQCAIRAGTAAVVYLIGDLDGLFSSRGPARLQFGSSVYLDFLLPRLSRILLIISEQVRGRLASNC
ncbi:hypothetical protein P153DRAFT_143641 [Dothidotthia symphoricarpi CBS 119687]|uniref:Uncharacterized protein n=1 Tax=Dothidotthia symphoricarpi CBS 119687 TaxID=1392245 RepID=A0A6A5ZWD9_9PLEO|nr:uncharacterized protein P153DRAFT_143641 [Dothidotthia symphoricarpi CBS 119687]KAF2124062.1 hypothetical protein P153DRAFT_143641 [Dothidotthia symphoricarpi CBS 119687]